MEQLDWLLLNYLQSTVQTEDVREITAALETCMQQLSAECTVSVRALTSLFAQSDVPNAQLINRVIASGVAVVKWNASTQSGTLLDVFLDETSEVKWAVKLQAHCASQAVWQSMKTLYDMLRQSLQRQLASISCEGSGGVRRMGTLVAGCTMPLTILYSTVQLLEEKLPAKQRRELQPLFDVAQRNIYKIMHVVQDCDMIDALEHGETAIRFAPVAFDEIIQREVDVLQDESLVEGCTIDFSCTVRRPFTVVCDAEKIVCVLRNLMTNAIKHVPPVDGVVHVVLERKGRNAVLRVCDNGKGSLMTQSERDNSFQNYRRTADDTQKCPEETGLGLSIAREIVRLHGGTLQMKACESGVECTAMLPYEHAQGSLQFSSGGLESETYDAVTPSLRWKVALSDIL